MSLQIIFSKILLRIGTFNLNIAAFVLLVLVVGNSPVLGQQSYSFYDVSPGLSQHTITAITQDQNGFLWIGTQYGLNRFDGVDYKTYLRDSESNNSVSSNSVTSLAYDKEENALWIGTYGSGISRLNLDDNSFEQYNVGTKHLSSDLVMDLYLDASGLLWIATEKGGLNVINTKSKKSLQEVGAFNLSQIKQKFINRIAGIDHFLFLGTSNFGLQFINLKTGVVERVELDSVPMRSIETVGLDKIYLGTNNGLLKGRIVEEQLKIDKVESVSDEFVIMSMAYDQIKSELFIGTENDGLLVLDSDQKIKQYQSGYGENQMSGNSIWSIFIDVDNIIWLGYYFNGLNKIDELESQFVKIRKFEVDERKVELNLTSAIVEHNDKLWIGTDGDGLFAYDKKKKKYIECDIWPNKSNKVVTNILPVNPNELWIGTWNDGLIIYDPLNDVVKERIGAKNKLSTNFIHSIHQDKKGFIYVSEYGRGVSIFKGTEKIKSFEDDFLISNKVTVIQSDCSGNLFFGTENSGIHQLQFDSDLKLESSNIILGGSKEERDNHLLYDILLDSQCNRWFATNNGLYMLKAGSKITEQIDLQKGLPSNLVVSIDEDEKGKIWGATNKGVFCWNPKTKTATTFNKADGLTSDEFMRGAIFCSDSGEIYFGGSEGVNYFNVNQLKQNKKFPKTFITRVKIGQKELGVIYPDHQSHHHNGQTIELDYDKNDVSFEFTTLNFTQAKQNNFKIKLKGLDKDWQEINHQRKVEYRNLRPGNYEFEVSGANNVMVWNEKPASFKFKIHKPWYDTILAWCCYIGILFGVLYFFIRGMLYREKLKSGILYEQKVVENMKEIDAIKSKFFANISHEFITPLTLIISPLKGFLSNSSTSFNRETAGMALKNAERLKKYIDQIMNLAKLESGSISISVKEADFGNFIANVCDNFVPILEERHLKLKKNIPESAVYLYFDENKMEQILNNLISNAIKYTKDNGFITINLQEHEESVILSVKDTGIGIAKEHIGFIFDRFYRERDENKIRGTGIGLYVTQELTQLHHGQIRVESEEGAGTEFFVTFKKGAEHFKNDLINSNQDINLVLGVGKDEIENSNELDDSEMKNISEKPIVLLADDNPDIRYFINGFLSNTYHMVLAKDGLEAFEKAKVIIPDIIITDLMMPKKNGFELVKSLKEETLTNHIGIIMLTVKSSEQSQLKGFEHGVDHYISKPFHPELLEHRIRNILSYREVNLKVSQDENKSVSEPKLSELDTGLMNDIKRIVLSNISDNNFSVKDLCGELGFSKSQLYRKLKAITNLTLNETIRKIKLEKAKSLLEEGTLNVSEITYKVGFNDLQYFRKCFKSEFGITPSQVLKKS